jgi:hypothetical protein
MSKPRPNRSRSSGRSTSCRRNRRRLFRPGFGGQAQKWQTGIPGSGPLGRPSVSAFIQARWASIRYWSWPWRTSQHPAASPVGRTLVRTGQTAGISGGADGTESPAGLVANGWQSRASFPATAAFPFWSVTLERRQTPALRAEAKIGHLRPRSRSADRGFRRQDGRCWWWCPADDPVRAPPGLWSSSLPTLRRRHKHPIGGHSNTHCGRPAAGQGSGWPRAPGQVAAASRCTVGSPGPDGVGPPIGLRDSGDQGTESDSRQARLGSIAQGRAGRPRSCAGRLGGVSVPGFRPHHRR